MTDDHTEALWRDFPKNGQEFEERFFDEEACRDYLIGLSHRMPLERQAGLRQMRRNETLEIARRQAFRVRRQKLPSSDQRYLGHIVSSDQKATESLVPGDFRALRPSSRRFLGGHSAHFRLWLLQHSMALDPQDQARDAAQKP